MFINRSKKFTIEKSNKYENTKRIKSKSNKYANIKKLLKA